MDSTDGYLRLATSEHKRVLSKAAFGQELRLACMAALLRAGEDGMTLTEVAILLDVRASSIQKPLSSMERCNLVIKPRGSTRYRRVAGSGWQYAIELMSMTTPVQDQLPFDTQTR